MSIQLYQELADLSLGRDTMKQFYCLHQNERVHVAGTTHRHEKKSYFHITVTNQYSYHEYFIELFDLMIKDRDLSASEKEYLLQLEKIKDELLIKTDRYGHLLEISNLTQLQYRAQKVIQKLSKKYIGGSALRTFDHLRKFYQYPQQVIANLLQYDQLGLLFSKFYGNMETRVNQKFQARFLNFLPHTLVQVTESLIAYRVNYEAGVTEVTYKGNLDMNYLYRPELEREMKEQKIPYSETDTPILDKYRGTALFKNASGLVVENRLQMQFSFGEGYIKEIDYSLTAVDAADVP